MESLFRKIGWRFTEQIKFTNGRKAYCGLEYMRDIFIDTSWELVSEPKSSLFMILNCYSKIRK